MKLKHMTISLSLVVLCSFVMPQLKAQDAATLERTSQDFIGVAKSSIPAVVSIQVKSKTSTPTSGFFEYDLPPEMFQDDFFGRFFGLPRKNKESDQVQLSQGSGFITSKDGYILTNNHLVKDASTITVKLNDGREFTGKIIGQDESTDVALIKIDASDLPHINLGNSDALQVGQWVVAIGNPLGLQASLTVGVVSAKGRSNLDIARIEDFIQTDAAINRGNSGGPLLNLKGEVIGINTAIATNYSNGYMGIGFAIPSNIAKAVMDQLISTGSITRGYLGILMQEMDADLAQAFDLKKVEGALVAEVIKDSPAEKAGLTQGDVILTINGKPVISIGALRNFIALQKPGTQVTLGVMREQKPLVIALEVGTFQEQQPLAKDEPTTNKLGIDVQTLTPDLAKSLKQEESTGVVVTSVKPSSAASLVGIQKGDLIVAVNNSKVTTKQEFDTAIKATPKEKPVLLLMKRGNTTRYVSIRDGQ